MDTKQVQEELAKKPVEELFLRMALKDDDPDRALKAYGEFYNRYHAFLEYTSKKVCISFGFNKAEVSEIIYSNTLVKIYNKAESFLNIDQETTEPNKDRLLKGWINKIAENELLQIKRRGEHDCLTFDNIPDEELPELTFDDTPPGEILLPDEMQLLEQAMLELTPTEQAVIQEIYLYKAKGKYTPREVIDKLSRQFNITHDSIRQIHFRANQKIKNKLISKTLKHEPNGRHTNYERRNL